MMGPDLCLPRAHSTARPVAGTREPAWNGPRVPGTVLGAHDAAVGWESHAVLKGLTVK